MPDCKEYVISLREASHDDATYNFNIDDDFFANVEQTDILGGQISVKLRIHHSTSDIFTFDFKGEGNVKVACDRCLQPVEIPISFEEQNKVGYAVTASEDTDMIVILPSQNHYDIRWMLYENIALNLPLQRIHSSGNCDIDMLSRFSQSETLTD